MKALLLLLLLLLLLNVLLFNITQYYPDKKTI